VALVRPALSATEMNEKDKHMSKLEWKLLTKKRGSSTQGLPPGKEDLAWVTNTATLICGGREAVLIDPTTISFPDEARYGLE
jgi:hypothetical protein